MHRFLALPRMVEVADGGVRVGAGDAVGRQAQVELELAQRKLGERAEDAVGGAAGEAERAQRVLQLQHVVAVEVRHAQVQGAVAQRERGVDERRPHLLGHLVGERQARAAAERLHGLGRGIAERPVDVGGIEQPDGDEALLHVFDRGTGVMSLNGFHERHGSAPRCAREGFDRGSTRGTEGVCAACCTHAPFSDVRAAVASIVARVALRIGFVGKLLGIVHAVAIRASDSIVLLARSHIVRVHRRAFRIDHRDVDGGCNEFFASTVVARQACVVGHLRLLQLLGHGIGRGLALVSRRQTGSVSMARNARLPFVRAGHASRVVVRRLLGRMAGATLRVRRPRNRDRGLLRIVGRCGSVFVRLGRAGGQRQRDDCARNRRRTRKLLHRIASLADERAIPSGSPAGSWPPFRTREGVGRTAASRNR